MKYSIFEFSQEKVMSLQKDNGDKLVRLDVIDLLILSNIADIIHRADFIKYIIEEKTFFSIQYKSILEDLPILNIGKQALSDRLKKMCQLNVLDSKLIKNEFGTFTVFRLGTEYANLKYSTSSEIQTGSYQNTNGVVSKYEPKDYTTNNTITNNNKENNKKKKNFDVRLDLSYVSESMLELWNKWLDYKDELNKQYKTERGIKIAYDKLVKFSNDDPVLANAIIQNSIEHSWDGFFDLTEKQRAFFLSSKSPYKKENDNLVKEKEKDDVLIVNGIEYK